MSIPRIGDKIVRVKKQIPQDTPQPTVAPEVSSSPEDSDYEEVSLDDLMGEDHNDISDSGNTQVQPESPAPVVEKRKPEDNSSIEKFTQDFTDNLHRDVLPMLVQYEPERKQRLFLAGILGAIFISIGIFLLLFAVTDWKAVVLMFGIAGLCAFWIKKSYDKMINIKVMPILMKAIPDFFWQLESSIPVDDITESMIFPHAKEAVKNFGDAFVGKYKGADIAITECKYTFNKNSVFSGALIRIELNKEIEGLTVIRPKKNVAVKDISDLKKVRMQKIESDDAEFNKLYNIYSTNQAKAKSLLTTSFLDCFRNIYAAFGANTAYCSFYGKYVYIAPYFAGNLLSICTLVKNIADEKQYMKFFEEFTSILALIDYFKSSRKR